MDTSRTLFILRHAKSAWDDLNTIDFDRPLKPRGVSDALKMATFLRSELENLDIIISSPANRAIHTTILFCRTIGLSLSRIQLNEELYEARESTVDKIVRKIPTEKHHAMIVGHNPTFTEYANQFLKQPIENLPTAGIVKLEFSANSWLEISKKNIRSSFFEFPKNQ